MLITETTLQALKTMRDFQIEDGSKPTTYNDKRYARVQFIGDEVYIVDVQRMATWASLIGKGATLELTIIDNRINLTHGDSSVSFIPQISGCLDPVIKFSFDYQSEWLTLPEIADLDSLKEKRKALAYQRKIEAGKKAVNKARATLDNARRIHKTENHRHQENLAWISSHSLQDALDLAKTIRQVRAVERRIDQAFAKATKTTLAQFGFATFEQHEKYIDKFDIYEKTIAWRDEWKAKDRKSKQFYKELARRSQMVDNHFIGLAIYAHECFMKSIGGDDNLYYLATHPAQYKYSDRYNRRRLQIRRHPRREAENLARIQDAEITLRLAASKLSKLMEPAQPTPGAAKTQERDIQPNIKLVCRFIPNMYLERARRKARITNPIKRMTESEMVKAYQYVCPRLKQKALRQAMQGK